MKSQKHTRNPYYNDIRSHSVIPSKQIEVIEEDWDEDLLDIFNNKQQKAERVIRSNRARDRRKESRYAKEKRLYGE